MSTKTRTASPTARKVVGSLAVLGAAAAVAGLGTYGTFTDSTTPLETTVASGTLSINLSQVGAAVPVNTTGFVPGDSMTRAVNLVNDGNLAFSAVNIASSAPTGSILTTDTTNGLQLAVKACSVAWTQTGPAQSPTYTCSGTQRSVLTGPVVNSGVLATPASLAAGGVDHLTFTVSLPTTADNTFQGKTASLSLAFTGTQAAGTAR